MPVKDNKYRLRALLILVVFSMSLLPRQVLHNFVTSHQHVKYTGHPGQSQLSFASFTCDSDDVFQQQSYHPPLSDSFPGCLSLLNAKKEAPVFCIHVNQWDFAVLRGPPVRA